MKSLSAGQSMRHATDADADTDCVFVILLMFPLDSPALVPTAAPPSLLSEVHLESQCSTDLAFIVTLSALLCSARSVVRSLL